MAKVLSSHLLSECRIKGEQRGRKEKGGKHEETGPPPNVSPQLWAAQVSLASCREARQKGFPLYLHQLLEGVVTGPQLGHSKSCGDTQRRQENVVLVILGVGQVLIEGGGKARIGSGQLPDAPVGGLGDLLLRALLLHRLLLRGAVNAQGVHGDVPRLGGADVLHGVPVTGHTAPEPSEQQGQKTCSPIGGQKAELSLAGRTPIPAARPRRAPERAGLQPRECGQAAGLTGTGRWAGGKWIQLPHTVRLKLKSTIEAAEGPKAPRAQGGRETKRRAAAAGRWASRTHARANRQT